MPQVVEVQCKGIKGILHLNVAPRSFKVVCQETNQEMTPTAFEVACGMASAKKWSASLKVGEQTLLKWMGAQAQRYAETSVVVPAAETPTLAVSVPAVVPPAPVVSVTAAETPTLAVCVPAVVPPANLTDEARSELEQGLLPAGVDPSNPLVLRLGFDGSDISERNTYNNESYMFNADHNVHNLFTNLDLGAI
jgi:hypothetical protein